VIQTAYSIGCSVAPGKVQKDETRNGIGYYMAFVTSIPTPIQKAESSHLLWKNEFWMILGTRYVFCVMVTFTREKGAHYKCIP
jgi:hypothetical protein